MCFKPEYGLLLLGSTFICWYLSILISREPSKHKRKLFLIAGIIADAGVLIFFKYFNILGDSIFSLFESVNNNEFVFSKILFPIGISFYTFKSLSYLIDVYRNVAKPEKHFGYFALYVSFFPQLVAGPIERANFLIPQLKHPSPVDEKDIEYGIMRIAWGFFKKVAVADTVAQFVNFTFNDIGSASALQLYITLLFFAVQLYADFSGYCDIAIGVSRLFGIKLTENFRQPYLSKSVAEYWTRWHITLTTWVRDYLFIPLNRGVTQYYRIYINTVIIFILIGMWHGGTINFLIFGLINGVLVVLQAIYSRIAFLPKFKSTAGKVFLMVWTFHLLILSGVIFRSSTLREAGLFYRKLFTELQFNLGGLLNGFSSYDFMISCFVSVLFISSVFLPLDLRIRHKYLFLFITLLLIIIFGKNNAETFYYFQF
ncbi:MAG: MBOAT family O-acyltransferase [Chitinophagales bacterium]